MADALIWVADVAKIVATAGDLVPERGPEHYDSTPIATTEVVDADPDSNWICFATAD